MKSFVALIVAVVSLCVALPSAMAQQPPVPQVDILKKTGAFALTGAKARITTGDDYYFVGPDDAREVLLAWNNPPESANGVLGMLFPAGVEPMDIDSWGVVLTFEEIGYVSDSDANTTDYTSMMVDMKRDAERRNVELERQGYAPVTLVGWADEPRYDADNHVLTWAKDLSFGGSEDHTLNYDIRVLGRRGVLVMQVVAPLNRLADVQGLAGGIRDMARFDEGSRYADHQPGVDPVAGVGLAGLIAGGAGVAVAKKVGILAVLGIILKKGFVFILAGAGALFAAVRRFLPGRNKTTTETRADDPEPGPPSGN